MKTIWKDLSLDQKQTVTLGFLRGYEELQRTLSAMAEAEAAQQQAHRQQRKAA